MIIIKETTVYLSRENLLEQKKHKLAENLTLHDFDIAVDLLNSADRIVFNEVIILKDRTLTYRKQ